MAMIGIHPVHRRLAELTLKVKRLGGYDKLSFMEHMDLQHCLHANLKLVIQLDELKQLAYQAHLVGDMDWQMEICEQIEGLEAKMI